ncbi:MAG: response regulator [Candidatus Rokubacteria bacterium]|nr:response regulator [Candidatus Rokubacteria bacterium]
MGKRVLVVDDEPWIAEILSDMLTDDGHEVDTADQGLLALGMVQLGAYDLILCDMRMPGLDGPGFYAELERSRPDLLGRILFVTGNRFTPEVEAFLDRTGAPCLPKPFSQEDVHRLTQELLRRGTESFSAEK